MKFSFLCYLQGTEKNLDENISTQAMEWEIIIHAFIKEIWIIYIGTLFAY